MPLKNLAGTKSAKSAALWYKYILYIKNMYFSTFFAKKRKKTGQAESALSIPFPGLHLIHSQKHNLHYHHENDWGMWINQQSCK
jgi:hypothetical protein